MNAFWIGLGIVMAIIVVAVFVTIMCAFIQGKRSDERTYK